MLKKTDIQEYCKDKSVVIIGNSAKILRERRGDFIEAHDIVVRFNRGYPLEEFYPWIGKRTDLWVNNVTKTNKYQVENFNKFHGVKYILAPFIRSQSYIPDEHRDISYDIPFSVYFEVFKKMNPGIKDPRKSIFKYRTDFSIIVPSSGAMIVNFFANYIKYKFIHIMGFDFLKTKNFHYGYVGFSHHSKRHKKNGEKDFILGLVSKNPHIYFISD